MTKKEDHKTNVTYKFGRAIQEIGYDDFKFGVLYRIKFNDWNELYDIEDEYIRKFDIINNVWNTRRKHIDIQYRVLGQEEKENIPRTIYHNEDGFGNINETYKEAKKQLNSITIEDTKQWLEQQKGRHTKPYKRF